ncbi:P-loop NTPase [Romeria aff. gracilis LEGE 07310]|uniref:P-loop NTPase n=1 Tax=Vasconcelosia minhoensis LEGE 07310 TaxID=915328 RepID=A0A8J7DCB3_9CYAN|nr:tyrosine-protein kinase domain-containing protein [Romeria gracilis]MBE9077483.1 P-loop NTPase [Romeria aff. gracilis LEGE 07310]
MASPLIKRYLLALQRYKWAGLASFLAVLGAAGVIALRPKPEADFYAQGVLVDNSPTVSFTATGNRVQAQGLGIINEEFLLSDVLLEAVSAELENRGISVTADELAQNTELTIDNTAADAGRRGRNNNTGTGRERVTVRYNGDDPETPQTILNVMFQGMVELSRESNKAKLRAILQALDERNPEIEAELRQAEQALEAYDRIEGPAIQASLDGSLLGAISGSQNQIRQNQIALAGIEAQMRSLSQQLGMTPEQAYASSALSADPIIANLRARIYDTESQIQLLFASDYKPEHPTVIELRRSLAALNQLLQERAAEVIGGRGQNTPIPSGTQVRQDSSLDPARSALANQLVGLKNQRDAILQQQQVLAQSAQDLRQQYSSLPNKQLERDRLAQQVALRRALYDQIQASRIDAEAADAETVSSLTVATPPFVVREDPETANPILVLLAGGVVGLIVGGVVIFLLDALDGTVRTSEDLETIFYDQELPVLGIIPIIKTRPAKAAPVLLQPDSVYNENYERFLSKLRLAGANGSTLGPRVVLITSTRGAEGKSISAFNIAIASARAGRRTLLVEADLRAPSRAQYLNIAPDPQSTVEPLRYYSGQLSENIRMASAVENLYVSPGPGPLRRTAGVLESGEVKRFLEDARGRFDMVVLDTPALSRCDDALLLESLTDGMILVTRPGVTEKAVLTAVLDELELSEDVRLLGAIINAADSDSLTAVSEEPSSDAQTAADNLALERELDRVPTGRVDF